LFALASTASYSFYIIMTRRMGATETPQSLILYSALAPVILTAPVLPAAASWPQSPLVAVILLGLGVFGAFGHWCLIRAYRMATTTALAPYPYVQMVWAILFGWLIFDQLPDRWTLLGSGIIVASGLYIVHREHRLRLALRTTPGADAQTLAKKL
ncbi:MAG: DMT family transporter, partial [Rhizobiaceae bacterium]|nr:DMT family transporter [Rhizobiaceae bacterium]